MKSLNNLDSISKIKKCISFIYSVDDTQHLAILGTGFYVLVTTDDGSGDVCYFVTAKHVIQDKNGKILENIVLRQNSVDGHIVYNIITLNPDLIFIHNDPDVDLVVFPTPPDTDSIDFLGIPSVLIPSKDTIHDICIREGDDVFFAGLFDLFLGDEKNHPIFRFGKMALMTDEKIKWDDGKKPVIDVHLHLLDCDVDPGNSGSPTFFNLNPRREPGQADSNPFRISLAGVVKGGIGRTISAITPAYQLREILFREDVVKNRNKK